MSEAEAGPGGATATYAQTRPQAVAEAPSIPSPSVPTVEAVVVRPAADVPAAVLVCRDVTVPFPRTPTRGGGLRPTGRRGTAPELVGDTTVLVSEFPRSSMDALGGGRLEVVGGCLGVSGSVIVWPYRTRVVSEDPLTISIPDKGTFALGDDVEIGGGYVLEHTSTTVEPGPYEVGGVTAPAECSKHDIFLAS